LKKHFVKTASPSSNYSLIGCSSAAPTSASLDDTEYILILIFKKECKYVIEKPWILEQFKEVQLNA
jgi:hypothetical protein